MNEEPSVIYEDPRFAVIEKPAGWMVHPIARSEKEERKSRKQILKHKDVPILTEWLLAKYPEIKDVGDDPKHRPGIVHRLDRDVSGIMIVARTQEYFEYLKKSFQTHAVKKYYFAIVAGEMKEKHGFIDTPIGRRNGTVKRSVFSTRQVKDALTEYRVLKKPGEDATLLEIQTHTGRTHQIRVHLSSIGHPIVGDPLYGGTKSKYTGAKRLYLHAFRIEFSPEAGKMLRLDTALPESFEDFLALHPSNRSQ
jgi:23S rRNA pseudouridine1911/1915/1917 synthase